MNKPGSTRDDILAILIIAGGAAAVAGGVAYMARRRNDATNRATMSLPNHAVVAPTPLKDIAAEAGVQPPTALAHLQHLEEEGKVQRIGTDDGPRYAVLPHIRCEWIDPDHRIHESWQSSQPIDWRFPLVSRVPDERAQQFLYEWLDRAQARQILPGFRSRFEKNQSRIPLVQVVVYGSCARGDAGTDSDLDLLLVGDASRKTMDALVSLAHEVALETGRPPDVRVMDEGTWNSSTPAFRARVEHEAKTVFSNDYSAPLREKSVVSAHD